MTLEKTTVSNKQHLQLSNVSAMGAWLVFNPLQAASQTNAWEILYICPQHPEG